MQSSISYEEFIKRAEFVGVSVLDLVQMSRKRWLEIDDTFVTVSWYTYSKVVFHHQPVSMRVADHIIYTVLAKVVNG